MKEIRIGGQIVGYGRPPFLIAEAGVNHNRRLDLALKLVDVAAKAGADAVKFQTFRAENVATRYAKMAAYQRKNLGKNESQLDMIKKLELPEKYWPILAKHCKKRGIIFMSTPHGGFQSVDLLVSLKVPAFKFGSGDLTNLPLLQYAARFKKPMIISTGMATMKEIKEAISWIRKAGNNLIIALQCTTNYPTLPSEVNLRAMQTMMKQLDVLVGYSDHSVGNQAAIMAAALGACLIEKHFTVDKNLPGPDQKASATPAELKDLVEQLKNVQTILGHPAKSPLKSELQYLPLVRKSVVARMTIKKGELFTRENLAIKRPGTGLPPKFYLSLLGKRAQRDIGQDKLIRKDDY